MEFKKYKRTKDSGMVVQKNFLRSATVLDHVHGNALLHNRLENYHFGTDLSFCFCSPFLLKQSNFCEMVSCLYLSIFHI